jgi:hypothetical protein
MALIPLYHVVPSYYEYDTTLYPTSPLIAGMFVGLNATSGLAKIASGAANSNTGDAIGIAGDSVGSTTGYTPYAADLVISGTGATRSTQNRVSDYFNEASGSGKITVYHSGGEFLTDQYTGQDFVPGKLLYCTAAGLATALSGTQTVGRIVSGPSAYPSGVPGTDIAGSITLGTYLRFVLTL